MGYPGLVQITNAGEVRGRMLTSDALPANWVRLDKFDVGGYTRVIDILQSHLRHPIQGHALDSERAGQLALLGVYCRAGGGDYRH